MEIDTSKAYLVTIDTSAGTIRGRLYPEAAPQTSNNFVSLARKGYYDGLLIHRVVKGFVLQTGDPTGTGSGGPGYRFDDEPIPDHLNYVKGTLAMANSGPNTNGSQFFVVLDNLTSKLPKNYTIFGIIEDGFEVLDEIGATPTTLQPGGGESSRPISDLIMQKVSIQELEE